MTQTQKPILVVGGGISGITAAVELAEVGKEVILVEQKPYLGGNVVKMNSYFPKLCPPTCGLEINFRRIRQNPRIKVYASASMSGITGEQGNFTAKVTVAPKLVKDTCTSCGKCVDACPEERMNEFNYGLDKTKAIYLSHGMAFPAKYTIDEESCKKESCGKCVEVCDYNAIDLQATSEDIKLEVSSVIFATGWKNYSAESIDNLHYTDYENVISNVEMERLLASNGPGNGKLQRPSDQQEPKEIVFVQCAGSRDENHLPYCSAVCCSASLKHALTIQEQYPDAKVKICYIDLRVTGRNEDFLNKVKTNANIELIKGKVGKIEEEVDSKNLLVEAEDILSGKKVKLNADLVVLATGITPVVPELGLQKVGGIFASPEQNPGIFAVACSKKPMDVSASVKDATAAALKALQL